MGNPNPRRDTIESLHRVAREHGIKFQPDGRTMIGATLKEEKKLPDDPRDCEYVLRLMLDDGTELDKAVFVPLSTDPAYT